MLRTELPRLAEVLCSLSLATDHAAGLPPDTAIRTSLLAVRLAHARTPKDFHSDAYYTGLLRFLGCSAYSFEMAERFAAGDDLSLLRELTRANANRPSEILRGAWRGANRRAPLSARVAAVARTMATPSAPAELGSSHCELAVLLARRLGMTDGVVAALGQIYERWDGRGVPARIRGDDILHVARIVHVAWRLAAHGAIDGEAAALEAARARSATELDPAIVEQAERLGPELFADVFRGDAWTALLAAEPEPQIRIDPDRLADIATAFAHFSDVKSPWLVGHSLAVAELACQAAAHLRLDEPACAQLRIAALLHDLGRVAIRNGLWDKRDPLSARERMEIQDHSSETERILARGAAFRGVSQLAASAHERLDATGYPRRVLAGTLDRAARVLAASDVAVALDQERPHRPAYARDEAMQLLVKAAKAGVLCADAVDAVLAVRGHERGRRMALPHVLTAREVEVVRLVARGSTNAAIAKALYISSATVKRHLENVFDKTGQRTRAALSVWAVEHGLV